jgi:hypothetical protein
MILKL